MFPVPTVPDKAVVKAWKGVVSPSVSSLTYLPVRTLHPYSKVY
jgi:hypothetical protein